MATTVSPLAPANREVCLALPALIPGDGTLAASMTVTELREPTYTSFGPIPASTAFVRLASLRMEMPMAQAPTSAVATAARSTGAAAAPVRATTMPEDAVAPSDTISCDICVIGAGAGGLAVATTAAAFGQRVVLIEKHKLGGECLNAGGLPSKALIASARRAHQLRTAEQFGISPIHPTIDPTAVAAHVREVVDISATNVSPERFAGLGIRVISAAARFIDKATVAAGDLKVTARRFVIATGSTPEVPAVAGLDAVPFFTSDTILENTRRIDRLIVIGAGATGLEMGLAYKRLGSTVTVLASEAALAGEDPELTAIALRALRAEGLDIREGAPPVRVKATERGVRVVISWNGSETAIDGSHLLLASGRKANVAELNLAVAGVKVGPNGIVVDKGLKTSSRRVFAIGDVTGAAPSTHLAIYHANVVLRRALFRMRAKAHAHLVPHVAFIEPELATVGLSEAEAERAYSGVKVLRWPFAENDRAIAERTTEGHVKVVTAKDGRILGAGIVGPQAGELIQVWAVAVAKRLTINDMTEWVAPYPTLGDINLRVAQRSYAISAGNPVLRWLVSWLGRLG